MTESYIREFESQIYPDYASWSFSIILIIMDFTHVVNVYDSITSASAFLSHKYTNRAGMHLYLTENRIRLYVPMLFLPTQNKRHYPSCLPPTVYVLR